MAAEFKSTRELIADKRLMALADDLAGATSFDSAAVGVAGRKSENYRRFELVMQAASVGQMEALLHHEAPMVRAYAAEGFMKMAPQKADSVFSLMADQTPVETMAGCMKGVEPIGVIAARTLAWNSPVGSLKGLSDRAAGDSGIPKKTVEFFQGLVARRQAEGVARKAASDFMVKQGKDPLRFDYYVKEITKSWLGRRTASVVAHEKRQTAAAAASRDIKLQVDLASGQVTVVK